jgi:ketosteroid isomerase-like protein
MDHAAASALLARLHEAQNQFYAGGDSAPLRAMLTPDVTWTIPGNNAVAGTYRGIDAVLAYFERRRALANSTFQLRRRDVLVGAGSAIAALTDGTATIGGQARHWSTVGLYEVRDGLIAACWLLALDLPEFDAIWS